ncbi:MAG: beta-N-acetylhexosaminidase [Gammaproteobacteria bacterium]|nr:beta-N-acetylhexosaminidase [Gammaproteobacteria bacterium]
MSLGPVMFDVAGLALQPEEREQLQHPLTGGVILFSRNFDSLPQLEALVREIHSCKKSHLLVAVDHEGGRVQRFREGFTRLPPLAKIGEIYDRDRRRGRDLAHQLGWLMASELRAVGVDFSFAPVLDLDYGVSEVIGDRAYHAKPGAVSDLALQQIAGMKSAGMAAIGKHFPGHGAVAADSHSAVALDQRSLEDIRQADLIPFRRTIDNGLDGVMPAHVIYPKVDPHPAGFSPFWLQQILRNELRFQGVIFSDDLTMEGASGAGDLVARAEAALGAGCDVALLCNQPAAVAELLQRMEVNRDPVLLSRLARLHGRHPVTRDELHNSPVWRQAVHALERINEAQSGSISFS